MTTPPTSLSGEVSLPKGAYTLFWLPAKSRARVVATDTNQHAPQVLHVNADDPLEGGFVLVEEDATAVAAGQWIVQNDASRPSAFLVGGRQAASKWRIETIGWQVPLLAWDAGEKQLWRQIFGRKPGAPAKARPFENYDDRLKATLARAEAIDIELQSFYANPKLVQIWKKLVLLQSLLESRPSFGSAWASQPLRLPESDTLARWNYAPAQGEEVEYLRVPAGRSFELEIEGPGVLDVQMRGLIATTSTGETSATLTIERGMQTLISLAAPSQVELMPVAPAPSASLPRTAVAVDQHTWLGRANSERILLTPGKQHYRLAVTGQDLLIRLRRDVVVSRMSAWFGGADVARQLRAARRSLAKLSPERNHIDLWHALLAPWMHTDISAQRIAALMEQHCFEGHDLLCTHLALALTQRSDATPMQRSIALNRACGRLALPAATDSKSTLQLRQDAQASLADQLGALAATSDAAACLGTPSEIVSTPYAQATARWQPQTPGSKASSALELAQSLLTQRPDDLPLRTTFYETWRERSMWTPLSPPSTFFEVTARWFPDTTHRERESWRNAGRDAGDDEAQVQAVGQWQAIVPQIRYELFSPADTWDQSRWSTLQVVMRRNSDVAGADSKSQNATVFIDGDPHHISISQETHQASWLVAPGQHTLEVHAPDDTRIYVDLPAKRPSGEAAARQIQQRMWPVKAADQSLQFHLPSTTSKLPLRLDLRLALEGGTQNSQEHRKIIALKLRDNLGNTRNIWLHLDAAAHDQVSTLAGPEHVSRRLWALLPAASGASELEIVATGYEDTLYASLHVRQAKTEPEVAAASAFSFGQLALTKKLERVATTFSSLQSSLQQVGIEQLRRNGHALEIEEKSASEKLRIRLERAQLLSELGDLRSVKDELQWLLREPLASLLPLRTAVDELMDKLRNEASSRYYNVQLTPPTGSTQSQLRFPVQGPDAAQVTLPDTTIDKQLRSAALNLSPSNPASLTNAMATLVAYEEETAVVTEPDPLSGLAFGLAKQLGLYIQGAKLREITNHLAGMSQWEKLDHAGVSAGFEELVVPVVSDPTMRSIEHALLQPPWPERDDEVFFESGEGTQLRLQRNRSTKLRLRAFCRPRTPPEPTQLSPSAASQLLIAVDREPIEQFAIAHAAVFETSWVLTAGAHALKMTLQGAENLRCAVVFDEELQASGPWQPVHSMSNQRWWSASSSNPVRLKVWGAGAVRLDFRTIGGHHPQPLSVHHLRPDGTLETTEVPMQRGQDMVTYLQRAPAVGIGIANSTTILLAEEGLHELSIATKIPEYLVQARRRTPTMPVASYVRPPGLLVALPDSWHQPESLALLSVGTPKSPLEPATSQSLRGLSRIGAISLDHRLGINQEADYETVLRRQVAQLSATWRREWMPNRLWGQAGIVANSENWKFPALIGASQWTLQSKAIPLRTRVSVDYGAQRIDKWATKFGAFADVSMPLYRVARWLGPMLILPSLQGDFRQVSAQSRNIAAGVNFADLNSNIYRAYTDDHPIAIKPGLRIDLRKFQGFRFSVAQDVWSNANVISLDRYRLKARALGLFEAWRGWTPGWWSYEVEYEFTYAFADDNRSQAFLRHIAGVDLDWVFSLRAKQRINVGFDSALVFQNGAYIGNRFFLNAGLVFDPGQALRHFAPQERRFRNEIGERWWYDPQALAAPQDQQADD